MPGENKKKKRKVVVLNPTSGTMNSIPEESETNSQNLPEKKKIRYSVYPMTRSQFSFEEISELNQISDPLIPP